MIARSTPDIAIHHVHVKTRLLVGSLKFLHCRHWGQARVAMISPCPASTFFLCAPWNIFRGKVPRKNRPTACLGAKAPRSPSPASGVAGPGSTDIPVCEPSARPPWRAVPTPAAALGKRSRGDKGIGLAADCVRLLLQAGFAGRRPATAAQGAPTFCGQGLRAEAGKVQPLPWPSSARHMSRTTSKPMAAPMPSHLPTSRAWR